MAATGISVTLGQASYRLADLHGSLLLTLVYSLELH